MHNALEGRGLTKRFVFGAGSCLASAAVLRGVDLTMKRGEIAAIIGGAASGKSTLLLALAGLLTIDAGEIRWFGETTRAAALRHTHYHISVADLPRQSVVGDHRVHLIDARDAPLHVENLERWISHAAARGAAVVLALRDVELATHLAPRVLTLHAGLLEERVRRPHTRTRVAEHHATAGPCAPI